MFVDCNQILIGFWVKNLDTVLCLQQGFGDTEGERILVFCKQFLELIHVEALESQWVNAANICLWQVIQNQIPKCFRVFFIIVIIWLISFTIWFFWWFLVTKILNDLIKGSLWVLKFRLRLIIVIARGKYWRLFKLILIFLLRGYIWLLRLKIFEHIFHIVFLLEGKTEARLIQIGSIHSDVGCHIGFSNFRIVHLFDLRSFLYFSGLFLNFFRLFFNFFSLQFLYV